MIPIIEKEKSMLKALEIYNRYWVVLQSLFKQVGNLAILFAEDTKIRLKTN
jgi:hypothetical protein